MENAHKSGAARGLTLIELLLACAILALLFVGSVVLYERLPAFYDLTSSSHSVTSLLRIAHLQAMAGDHDAAWGVKLSSGEATLFRGTSYTLRDTSADERVPLYVEVAGTQEYVFTPVSGLPVASGQTMLIGREGQGTSTITVHPYGTIDTTF